MALSNRERQARYRDERNAAFQAINGGSADEFTEAVIRANGVKQARKLATALLRRLNAIDPKCKACGGTGYLRLSVETACGIPLLGTDVKKASYPCDCGPLAAASLNKSGRRGRGGGEPCSP